VAVGNGQGNEDYQLSEPQDVIIDKENDSLIICEYENRRVVRWPRRNGTSGETIISNIDCFGLIMDENGFLYVVDLAENEVRRYKIGDTQSTVVAGIVVDQLGTIYVADYFNHRIMRWPEGVVQGTDIIGENGKGAQSNKLKYPVGLSFDRYGNLYVSEYENHRVQKFNIE
ncbi:unnamed protein product, partial [Rotaria sp. Silwood1]